MHARHDADHCVSRTETQRRENVVCHLWQHTDDHHLAAIEDRLVVRGDVHRCVTGSQVRRTQRVSRGEHDGGRICDTGAQTGDDRSCDGTDAEDSIGGHADTKTHL